MSTLRALALASAATFVLVACVAPVDDLTDEERRQLQENDQQLADEIHTTTEALKACDYDKTKADKLGTVAHAGAGAHSKSACYHYVKQHLTNAGFKLPSELSTLTYGNSAADFIKFANNLPKKLDTMGLQPVSAGVTEKLPKGVMMVWPRGMCGYSKKHGHIEIICNDTDTQACSDFIGRDHRSKTCVPHLYAPKGSCAQADSCTGKADGYYCSSISTGAAYGCRSQTRTGAVYCPTGKKCGTAGAAATVSGGSLQCK